MAGKVDNPEAVFSYSAAPKRGGRNFDLLILTTSDLADAFQPLKDYHDTTNVPTEIHTLDETRISDPDTVRQYISDRYVNDGVTYVIIGGDDDVMPDPGWKKEIRACGILGCPLHKWRPYQAK